MKAKLTYLKGKSIFIVSIIVITITVLTVYFTGKNLNRSLESNFYISLGIISGSLFTFIFYGLYKGIGLIDNFPIHLISEPTISKSYIVPELPNIDIGEGIGGLILSILLWIVMSIIFVVLLFFLEAIILFSIFIIIGMLYWVFFRALKLIFKKSADTKNNLIQSIVFAFIYTLLYTGWLFGLVYLSEFI